MKFFIENHVVKACVWGDSVSKYVKFKVYKPRKLWFNKLVYTDVIAQDMIHTVKATAHKVVQEYHVWKRMWE